MRIMTFPHPQTHAPPLYRNLNILQFSDIVFIQISKLMFDYYNNSLPSAFSNYFKGVADVHSSQTRHSRHNLFTPSVSTNYGKFSLSINGVKVWNSIDDLTKTMKRDAFKRKIRHDCFLSYD